MSRVDIWFDKLECGFWFWFHLIIIKNQFWFSEPILELESEVELDKNQNQVPGSIYVWSWDQNVWKKGLKLEGNWRVITI